MIKVAVIGGSGYTGAELLRLLSQHPRVKLTAVSPQGKEAVIGILARGLFSVKGVLPDSWCVSPRRRHWTLPWSRESTRPP